MMAAMKTITATLTGLASSLLLNVRLTGMAQNLDPLGQPVVTPSAAPIRSAELCAVPCAFARRKMN
jgi:hypothetical protein